MIINPCIQVFETLLPEILYWLLKEPIVAIIEWILENLAFRSLFKGGQALPFEPPGTDSGAKADALFKPLVRQQPQQPQQQQQTSCDPPCEPPLQCGPQGTCVDA